MDFISKIRALFKQREPAHRSEGEEKELQGSRLGQLFTAGWKERLLLAGCCYNVTVGDAANGGGAPAGIVGGGNGTTIDSDQPELAVGVPTGYYLIPLRFQGSAKVDLDADGEIGEAAFFADTVKNIPLPVIASSTLETPTPMLGGGRASIAYAQSAVTTDIVDPVASVLLAYEAIQEAEVTAAGVLVAKLSIHYEPDVPPIFKGPCSLIGVFGGTAAVTGLLTLDYAEIPASWVE